MTDEYLKIRIAEYRRDPILNFLQDKMALIDKTEIPSYLLKDNTITILPNPKIEKLEKEMKDYRESKYPDLFP